MSTNHFQTQLFPATLFTIACLLQSIGCNTQHADQIASASTSHGNLIAASSTGRPAELLTPPPPPINDVNGSLSSPPLYQRIAHWFGFGGGVEDAAGDAYDDKNPSAVSGRSQKQWPKLQPHYVQQFPPIVHYQYFNSLPHSHQRPSTVQRRTGYAGGQSLGGDSSAAAATLKRNTPCNPCNKVPWTPMIQSRQRHFGDNAAAAVISSGYPPLHANYPTVGETLVPNVLVAVHQQPPNVEPHLVYGVPATAPTTNQLVPLGPTPIKLVADSNSIQQQHPVNYGLPAKLRAQSFNSYAPTAALEDFAGGNATPPSRGPTHPYSYAAVQLPQPYSYQHQTQQFSNQPQPQPQVQPQRLMHIALPTYAAPIPLGGRPLDYQQYAAAAGRHQHQQQRYVPIPVPNLSQTPLPPLFPAKPFQTNVYGYSYPLPTVLDQRQLQPNEYVDARYGSGNGWVSSTAAVAAVATAASATTAAEANTIAATLAPDSSGSGSSSSKHHHPDDDVEIIRSVPLAEFTSSVQYPIQVSIFLIITIK